LDLSAALGAAKGKQTRDKFREVKGKKNGSSEDQMTTMMFGFDNYLLT
jgi:hypothetical protein